MITGILITHRQRISRWHPRSRVPSFVVSLRSPTEAMEQASPPCGHLPSGQQARCYLAYWPSRPPRLRLGTCCLASLATRSHGAGFPTLRPTSPRVNKLGITSLIDPRGRQGSALEPVVSLRSPTCRLASLDCSPLRGTFKIACSIHALLA